MIIATWRVSTYIIKMFTSCYTTLPKKRSKVKMSKGNGKTITLLFSLNGIEILHQGRRGQVTTTVMEYLTTLFSTSPHLLTSCIPINQSIGFKGQINPIFSKPCPNAIQSDRYKVNLIIFYTQYMFHNDNKWLCINAPNSFSLDAKNTFIIFSCFSL